MNTCQCCGDGDDFVTTCATNDGPDLELCPPCSAGRCPYGTSCLLVVAAAPFVAVVSEA